MSEPCDLSAREARRLIGAKALSPVELLQSCFARIDAVNRQLNAVVAQDRDRAMVEARAAEQAVVQGKALGPLHGLPIGIKDMVDTAGLRTTYGSLVFRDQVPAQDAGLVKRLREAGAIAQFKTNTPEWAAGGNTFNPVYGVSGNPFAPELTCGGSSGGSGIGLATGMFPLAHGSDNAGSLRIPAAFNGVVGLRPTAGLVPYEKRAYGSAPLSVEGPMARDVRDLGLLLSAYASDDPRDPLAGHVDPRLHANLQPLDLSRLRVAFSADLGGFAPIDSHLRTIFEKRRAELARFFLKTDEACFDLRDADVTYKTRRAIAFVGTWHKRMQENPGKWGRLVTGNYEDGLKLSAIDVARAEVRFTEIYRGAVQFFGEHDLLITPTCSVSPWPKHEIYPRTVGGREMPDYIDWVRMTYGITLINHPAISIPCGVDGRGLPFGLQVVAGRGRDAFLLQAAMALEAVLPARPRPDIHRLSKLQAEDPLARPVA
ncbi:MAG TPA: amidase family protein [Burkholderiales bacterium]|nr:amidase family protein [Burkholderiales bacterium]